MLRPEWQELAQKTKEGHFRMPVTGPKATENMIHLGNYRYFSVWEYIEEGFIAWGWR